MKLNKSYLNSERIFLREFIESDWAGVHKYASQEIVSQYQVWEPNTKEDSKAFVNQVLIDKSKSPRRRYVYAVVLKETDELIGAGEINARDFSNKSGDIAYIIHPDYWGKGFATVVAKLLIDFGFETINLHRIFAYCNPNNLGSVKVLEKAGLTHEGRLRENLLMKDGWRDSLIYSILENEWKE